MIFLVVLCEAALLFIQQTHLRKKKTFSHTQKNNLTMKHHKIIVLRYNTRLKKPFKQLFTDYNYSKCNVIVRFTNCFV